MGHYCEFGTCEAEQYCCGEDKCCNKLIDLWYFWFGIALAVLLIGILICLQYWRKRRKLQSSYRYTAVSSLVEDP